MTKYTPDPFYNPDFQEKITARTKLGPGITMAKFLGGNGGLLAKKDTAMVNHCTASQEFNRFIHAACVVLNNIELSM